MAKRRLFWIAAAAAALLVSSCAIPFNVTTDKMVFDLPGGAPVYAEKVMDIPAEALKSNITYSEIKVSYRVTKSVAGDAASGGLYVSTDQVADNVKGASDEKLIDIAMDAATSILSGTKVSAKIKEALDKKQAKLVIGAENTTVTANNLHIEMTLTLKGSYSVF